MFEFVFVVIVIFVVSYLLYLFVFWLYWVWYCDWFVVIVVLFVVFVFGVLYGLFVVIGVSLLLMLCKLFELNVSVFGWLCDSYDFVDVVSYVDVKLVLGVLIVWFEV